MQDRHILFTANQFEARELADEDIPALQQFYEENAAYFILANDMPARDDEAQREFDDLPPPEMPFNRRFLIGFYKNSQLIGMATVLSDFLAAQVWQISFFIISTSLHGSGSARDMYGALEHWMECNGAQWIRLGVIIGNHRAERFWEKCGYVETRKRSGVIFGNRIHTLRVMAKPFNYATIDQYLTLVLRDRPETP
ncbi:MAG TPA: GNAT family N-acetyltransferase [Steroidobacteraceae bacterium]|nr:GNAT family N-acetyltransferase [Steroidobacteraceae bacterium]